ncbi:MAG: hypothetical protein WCE62_19745 [Polyangiales bacterium]
MQRVGVLATVVVLGCGNSESDKTVTLDLTVVEFDPGSDEDTPFEGAEVCVADTSNCATSDADGIVQLEIPANAELELLVTAEGYTPTLTPQTTSDQDITTQLTPLLSDQTATLLAGVLNTPYPLGDNGLAAISVLTAPVTASNNGIAGVTLTPDPGATVFYLDENEFPTRDLSATTAPSGAGGLIEVAPGTWELDLGGTASNCVIVAGWPGSTDSSVRLPVRAGFVTQGFVTCDPVASTP